MHSTTGRYRVMLAVVGVIALAVLVSAVAARSAAVGAALACVALDDSHPEHEILFDRILRADRTLLQHRRYAPGIGAIARRWAWSGPGMVSRVLGRLDSDASLHARLRYTTATPWPRWPDLPAEVITRR
jgi:hypothetical protein